MNLSNINPRILNLTEKQDIEFTMKQIGADPCGIKLMAPKSKLLCIKLHDIESRWSNILKQEILSIGGELAVSKNIIYDKKSSHSDALLIGTISQLKELTQKLEMQPSPLKKLKDIIKDSIHNFSKREYTLRLPDRDIYLKDYQPLIMGIVNLTPDSFSKDGFYRDQKPDIESIIDKVMEMVEEGADIIDIGGESTRPGTESVEVSEELKRVMPVLEKLVSRIDVPISIDTYKAEVAKEALDCGVTIINDVYGLNKDNKMIDVLSKAHPKPGLIIMHMKGTPRDMQQNPQYQDIMKEIFSYFKEGINKAIHAGLVKENIILDPGIGFGKTLGHNFFIIRNLEEFKTLGYPILIGTSRKSFIGKALNLDVEERLLGTAASVTFSVANGANIVRVHDVKDMKQVCELTQRILTQTADNL